MSLSFRAIYSMQRLNTYPNQVYVITGANTGVGKELAQMLYAKNAKVVVAARSEEKALKAIKSIESSAPKSLGVLEFLKLDLADLTTIKKSAQDFLSKENRLDVLFNNAGVMLPAEGSKAAQGYELQLGVNNVGTFMFTKLLTPTLVATAKTQAPGSVRVVWVSSSAAEAPVAPMPINNMEDVGKKTSNFGAYAISKAGNYFQGTEFARRYRDAGIVSIPLNPGNLDSDLWRTQGSVMSFMLRKFILHPPINGAYTELYAGLSPAITMEQSGNWSKPASIYSLHIELTCV